MTMESIIYLSGFLITFGGVIYGIAYARGKQDSLEKVIDRYKDGHEEKFKEHKRQIDALWEYKDSHEKEVESKRTELDREITAIKVMIGRSDARDEEILRRLSHIEELLKK